MTPTRMLTDLTRPYRARLLLGTLMVIVSTAAMMAMPQLLKHMFDSALVAKDSRALSEAALGMVGVALVMALGLLVRGQLIQLSATRVACDLREKVAAHLMTLDISWFEGRKSGEILSRLVSDIGVTREFVQTGVPMLVRGSLIGVGSLIALFATSPKLAAILLLALIPMVLSGVVLGRKIKGYNRYQQDKLAEFSGALGEQLATPALWKMYGQEERAQARTHSLMNLLVKGSRRQLYARSALIAVNVLAGFVTLTGVVWLGGLDVMAGHMSVGDMMAFLLYLGFMADAVSNLGEFWPTWQGLVGSLERVGEILAEKSRLPVGFKGLLASSGGRALALEGVSYAYPSRPDDVALAGIDWRVEAGKTVALVGPSGAGKSTLLRLLMRLDDPAEGKVLVDGLDAREVAPDVYRTQFALVAQDSPLLAGTVRDNVAFGAPSATDEAVWDALRVAHADGFVRALPQGLDTPVGERGVQLSGGQKQRLALARAVLVDAPVLLLDEATSQLDSESEAAIQDALADVAKGRTVVMIAHRLSTVRFADRLDVVEDGRIVASGKHEELLKKSELYAALVALQLR